MREATYLVTIGGTRETVLSADSPESAALEALQLLWDRSLGGRFEVVVSHPTQDIRRTYRCRVTLEPRFDLA